MGNHRRAARIAPALLLAMLLAACGSTASIAPTPAPTTAPPAAPTTAPTTAPTAPLTTAATEPPTAAPADAPTTAPTVAAQQPLGPVAFVRVLDTTTNPLKQPMGLAVDSQGNLYVADSANNRIQKYDRNGAFVTMWGTIGTGEGQLQISIAETGGIAGFLATDQQGNVYVSDSNNRRVQKFDGDGTLLAVFPIAHAEQDGTGPVVVDGQGAIIVTADTGAQQLAPSGQLQTMLTESGELVPVAIDQQGRLYLADLKQSRLEIRDASGAVLRTLGSNGSGDGQFEFPIGVAFDSHNNIYVTDPIGHRVQVFDAAGKYLGQWSEPGNGDAAFSAEAFQGVSGIAIDAQDTIYLSSPAANAVYVYRPQTP